MMAVYSAGILPYRYKDSILEVMLVHPGGPFWAKKDDGSWSVSKGIVEEDENALTAAKREFSEETGFVGDGEFLELGSITQPSRKVVTVFALEQDFEVSKVISNTFKLEWPTKSGKYIDCPEVDRAEWFSLSLAKRKILKGQVGFIAKLAELLKYNAANDPNVDTGEQMSLF
jgi:predicted NUDIX family NTP pyrophosphohydrolase